MPIIVVLFLFSAFQMFPIGMPGHVGAIFMPIVGLTFPVSAVFHARRLISRMQMLVQDALIELASGQHSSV